MPLRRLIDSGAIAEVVRYGLIGVLNTLLTLAIIFAAIYWLDAPALLANAIGYVVGFICSYLLNRLWTFRSQAPMGRSIGRYVLAALLAYAMNALVIFIGIAWYGASEYLIQPLGAAAYTLTLFVLSKAWVFKNKSLPGTS